MLHLSIRARISTVPFLAGCWQVVELVSRCLLIRGLLIVCLV